MQKPVLTVFLDGLKHESVKNMPFLNSFPHTKRIKTTFGYSISCHATMYSGVYPNKHLVWFIWKYSPSTSPFRWVKPFKDISIMDNLPGRYFVAKTAKLFTRNSSFGGIPLLTNASLRNWPCFDVVERKLWNEPGYLENHLTIFDILREHGVEFDVVGIARSNEGGGELKYVEEYSGSKIKPWTYLFIGELDQYSHKFKQDSPQTMQRLKRTDRAIQEKYRLFEEKIGDFDFICFSDHGHMEVRKRVDIQSFFKSRGRPIDRYIHLIESTFARFWFRNKMEREEVISILSDFRYGRILTDEVLRKYHVNMPDNRYGDLIFYLDAPNIFSSTIWGFGRSTKSMHGYLPDYPEKDGVFISNKAVKDVPYVHLTDIMPSVMALFDLRIPDYVDGRVLWKDD